MHRPFLTFAAAVVGATLFVSSAFACINDSDTLPTEREFKSHYIDKPQGQPTPAENPSPSIDKPQLIAVGGYGGGIALLTGSLLLSYRRSARIS